MLKKMIFCNKNYTTLIGNVGTKLQFPMRDDDAHGSIVDTAEHESVNRVFFYTYSRICVVSSRVHYPNRSPVPHPSAMSISHSTGTESLDATARV